MAVAAGALHLPKTHPTRLARGPWPAGRPAFELPMFASFERLIDPYPEDSPAPPARLSAFYWSFIRPVWHVLVAVAVLSALI